jgi:Ca-activated chloride channel family protein
MAKRARLTLLAIVLLLFGLIALFLARCTKTISPEEAATVATAQASSPAPGATPAPEISEAAEVLTPATLQAAANVVAGARFAVDFIGPKNPRDYVTIVEVGSPATAYGNYAETKSGNTVELTAPIQPGNYELRYVTNHSKTVLGKASLVVSEATASVTGPDSVILGKTVSISWTGPDNDGDYITVVAQGTPDGNYGNYTLTSKGSPLELTMPVDAGDAELRYMTGQGAKVLARRPIKIATPDVSLNAPDRVEAGGIFQASWTGPNNHGDYITIVPKNLPDGQYANYTETDTGSPMNLTALIEPGSAELRYMTGTGARVLARRSIEVVAAKISIDAPAEVTAGAPVQIIWIGPNNPGDYITVVPRSLPYGQYAKYADTTEGSPLAIESPREAGPAEIRYMSGQGAKVLARVSIELVPAK